MQYIIADIREAGWSVRKKSENDKISDSDLRHVFRKVDIDHDENITKTVENECNKGWHKILFSGAETCLQVSLQTV